MILAETGTLEMDTKIQYIRMLVCGEVLRQFYLFSAEIENTETLNVDYYIKGLALYFFLWTCFQKNCVMHRGMKNHAA